MGTSLFKTVVIIGFVGMILQFMVMNAMEKDKKTIEKNISQGEIIYHVFLRSFYDSNGDNNGDLNGLRMKLDYLQELGITSILLTPLYDSHFYHNYFAIDFKKIDPRYGTVDDYLALVKEIHRRGMKIYLDMETQYVAGNHPWFKDFTSNPNSPEADYLLRNPDDKNQPEGMFHNFLELKSYDGTADKIATVNLNNTYVQEYNYELFKYFLDPNGDGKFDDGVDGFRLDHMMDDLDSKGLLTNLFSKFWIPLLTRLRQVNPDIKIVAEQANWGSYGFEYLTKGSVDRVFAFRLQAAISSFNKGKISSVADTTFLQTPPGKQQVVFIENHDIQRFATTVNNSLPKLKIGAALNLLIGGVPSIYYGQELGMRGEGLHGPNDGNDIPKREAFEWYKADTGKGMALWYKNTGEWWNDSKDIPNDGISLEEEKNDPQSLWNFYKKIIHIRKAQPVLETGSYQTLLNNNGSVYTFERYENNEAVIVAVNLSDTEQKTVIDFTGSKVKLLGLQPLWGDVQPAINSNEVSFTIPAYGIQVWEIK